MLKKTNMVIASPDKIQAPTLPAVHQPGAEYDTQALPSVELDTSLAHLVEHINVDSEYFATLMADKGMSDADIAETTIFISADTVVNGDPADDNTTTIQGYHDSETRRTQVNIGSIVTAVNYMKVRHEADGPVEESTLDEVGSAIASEKMVHEISHRIDAALGRDVYAESLDYYSEVVPEKIIGKVFRKMLRMTRHPLLSETADMLRRLEVLEGQFNPRYEHYEGAPEEVRANKLSEEELQKFDEEGKYPVSIMFKRPFPQTVS